MTEKEAKQKWCPFARCFAFDGRATFAMGNRIIKEGDGFSSNELNPAGSRCIGSACMAWRWGREPVDFKADARVVVKEGDRSKIKIEYGHPEVTGEGYCGLAR
jgi:hypothetical protein